jgi:2-polyprenyl-3-methyl-5-hydroxy-6-metoxy-1,4-benzoquinol methylase
VVGAVTTETALRLDYPALLADDFAAQLPGAARAVDAVVERITNHDFSSLAEHSPELTGNAWPVYLRCSIARMVHMAAALERRGIRSGRILDYGSYFGNISLMFRERQFEVEAVDGYATYGAAFGSIVEMLRQAGVMVRDFNDVGRDLHGLPTDHFDVIFCMGVIEHIPHTARTLLQPLNRVLKPGGWLVIDTPNIAYLYNRQRLARGESVMATIASQYYADPPFEGHHREYTAAELVWMLRQIGHRDIGVELFNYSVYSLPVLTGADLANYWATALDPSARELILTLSRKPRTGEGADADTSDWPTLFNETEPSWVRRVPPAIASDLQRESARDVGARQLEQYYLAEIARRDRDVADANGRLGALQQAYDRLWPVRLRRYWQGALRAVGRGRGAR